MTKHSARQTLLLVLRRILLLQFVLGHVHHRHGHTDIRVCMLLNPCGRASFPTQVHDAVRDLLERLFDGFAVSAILGAYILANTLLSL